MSSSPGSAQKAPASALDARYLISDGRAYMSGYHALVRLLLIQRQRDTAAGLNCAGFVSGYRGSPLGGLDMALWEASAHLAREHIVFQPGINEDLGATAVWGSQQVNLFPGARYDGVFALWYGKGPGVDRCGDVFRHANAAGSSRLGGVLVVAGDDHAAKSSMLPHQTDHFFKSMMMPVLSPAGVQDYLDFGVHGWALSRYSGCWVAFKTVSDSVETSASVDIDPFRVRIVLPSDFALPEGGLNIRWPDPPLQQEHRLLHYKLYAALAYCRANRLNQVVLDSPHARLGIISAGKSYLDVRQALEDLGIDAATAARIGLRVYKVGMVWPLEAEGVRRFAEGLEEILVVEEKRQLIEYQLKEELYNWREDVRPRVVGKFDEKGEWALSPGPDGYADHGAWLLPAAGEHDPARVARVIAARLARFHDSPAIRERLAFLDAKQAALQHKTFAIERTPTFCPGCPHNSSTRVPEGSRASAGIGCHYMANWIPARRTSTFTQMGGEGVTWLGLAPFTSSPHLFANLGDGTYFHSGLLAIRQAVAAFRRAPLAGHGLTYKILYNDAVAMTGGQPVDGELSVPRLVAQLRAEGVHNIVLVSGEEHPSWQRYELPAQLEVRPRDELDAVQRELRELPGVSVLIYDQACAAEKRRRRKRGSLADPARRLYINAEVCEGCGDCGVQSNCMAVLPLETPFGRKRMIDQTACNKDFSCLKGFCPSFVSIEGGTLRKGPAQAPPWPHGEPPAPELPATMQAFGILVSGVGGSGVITLGALIGMAAHLDGKAVTVMDMTGLAQKGGSVYSHVRIADQAATLHAVRLAPGGAHSVIGGDLIVTASEEARLRMAPGITRVIANNAETPTAQFAHDADWPFPRAAMEAAICAAVGAGNAEFIDAQALARQLFGDTTAGNLLLLGFAWQRGWVPVSAAALEEAIRLNGVAIEQNLAALRWGRRAAHQRAAVEALLQVAAPSPPDSSLDALLALHHASLCAYQDAAWAARYQRSIANLRAAEARYGSESVTRAAAHSLCKLMSYKDEYEVARLYSEGSLRQDIAREFSGNYRLVLHLAPPLWAKPDPRTGLVAKRAYGPWVFTALKYLARLRRWRGSWLDLFGRQAERRVERALITQFEADLARLASELDAPRLAQAAALAALPQQIRGFGHIKRANLERVERQRQALWQQWSGAAKAAEAASAETDRLATPLK